MGEGKNIEFILGQLCHPLKNNPKHIPDINCEIPEKIGCVERLSGYGTHMRDGGSAALVCTCHQRGSEGKVNMSCDAVFHTAHAASAFQRRPNKAPLIIWGKKQWTSQACMHNYKSLPSQGLNSLQN